MTEKSIDILCVGEALIDFIGAQVEAPIKATKDYHRYLGGSPTNVAMNLARLGSTVHMVATVGADGFGDYILKRLQETDIQLDAVRETEEAPTTVIFVNRTQHTPEFIPMRGADSIIERAQISDALLSQTKIYHTTCFALSREPARSTILDSAQRAKALGCTLSIDINFSPQIWPEVSEAKKTLAAYLSHDALVKVSQDDMDRLFGKGLTHNEIFERLHAWGASQVCLTLGKEGAKLSQKGHEVLQLSALQVDKIMDATGAGDAFWSGFLFGTLKEQTPEKCMATALKMAAIKLQNVGRVPDYAEVLSDLLKL
ncbi:carbohydrate kinase family protein [Altibacter sp. HG106]|uniref:carbohydrate kinase family protein n=1 Tax=Altibacter sp. HG106 TaxID=3023937 RepID=UPI002350C8C7|nr:PfkB family carbohydrate kinase [Altibacter sp. HG106]MDC7994249.1 PfkB family carbohydrate kinase [Altibacter sp. HG106]